MSDIIFIVGPTATGKTEVSFLLACRLKAQIVSADAMLIYKEPRIITSKPPASMRRQVPHHLIDVISATASYSVFDYYVAASAKIRVLVNKGIRVVVTGGSGLYLKALLDGIFEGAGQDASLRRRLEGQAAREGRQSLHAQLQKVDQASAAAISPGDLRRIVRALEVYHTTGVPLSLKKKEVKGLYGRLAIKIFGLRAGRELLYERINCRVDQMFAAGAAAEVEELLKQNLSLTARKIIGLKEIGSYLAGQTDQETAKEAMKKNTRNYAKRQITWFKKDQRIKWIDIDSLAPSGVSEAIIKCTRP